MMTRLILPVVAFFTLVSCSTNTSVPDMRMPGIQVHVFGTNVVSRSLASDEDVAQLEPAFLQILGSNDAGATTKLQLERSVRLFFRAQSLMHDFDQRLTETGENILVDDVYARLVAAKILRDQSHATIRYVYARALEIQHQHESGVADADASPGVLKSVAQIQLAMRQWATTSEDAADRLAKQDVIEDLRQVHEEARAGLKTNGAKLSAKVEAFDKSLKAIEMTDAKTLEAFYAKNDASIGRRARVTRTDSEINVQIDALVPWVREQVISQFVDQRSPQAAGIRPQVGPNGMMSGSNYRDGRWSLTFDDGPHATYTPMALANLKAAGMKTTFFWLAQNTKRLSGVVAKAKADDMVLACHSYSHPQLPKLSAQGLQHEITDAANDETSSYGQRPDLFRCPYGACGSQTSAIRRLIAANDMVSVIWNVDSLDWQDKNPSSVVARVRAQMAARKHGIILFHDIHPQSIEASKRLMADFKHGTLRSLTVKQAMDELNSPGGMQ